MPKSKRIFIKQLLDFVGQEVCVKGLADNKRDHGKITFIDLKDFSGVIQCVGFQKMQEITKESSMVVMGLVKKRPEKMINSNLPTGSLEIEVLDYQILNKAHELPIEVDSDGLSINEELRLKYRYLDLKRPRMRNILAMRSQMVRFIREYLYHGDFLEIETPLLTKATKEGARDFLVPSRLQKGKFYALPQSPQQYKQLLMLAGFERYFQIARCIRDEDLRADRGFEFTQLDLEMSFVTEEDIRQLTEKMIIGLAEGLKKTIKEKPFPRFTYQEAIKKFGADKFDLRNEEEKKAGILSFAWVVDFPFFKKVDQKDEIEKRDGKSGWTFTHNPFSLPKEINLTDHLQEKNIAKIIACQYDLVCNGYEVGGGSLRAFKREILAATFSIMGYTKTEIEEGVGHMLKAFDYGIPPHGGIALGIDRLVMLFCQEESLREVIPFPMNSNGKTAVMDAPSVVSDKQLIELSLQILDN